MVICCTACFSGCLITLVVTARQDEKLPVSCDRKVLNKLHRLRLDAAEDVRHLGEQFWVSAVVMHLSFRTGHVHRSGTFTHPKGRPHRMTQSLDEVSQSAGTCRVQSHQTLMPALTACAAAVQGAVEDGQHRLRRLPAASSGGRRSCEHTHSQWHRCATPCWHCGKSAHSTSAAAFWVPLFIDRHGSPQITVAALAGASRAAGSTGGAGGPRGRRTPVSTLSRQRSTSRRKRPRQVPRARVSC
jgi:hypothetical protein